MLEYLANALRSFSVIFSRYSHVRLMYCDYLDKSRMLWVVILYLVIAFTIKCLSFALC